MQQKDFRGIGRDAQEALRARAVFLVLTVGKTQAEAAQAVGTSRQTVNQWLKRHAKTGEAGLRDGRRISARKGQGRLTATEARPSSRLTSSGRANCGTIAAYQRSV